MNHRLSVPFTALAFVTALSSNAAAQPKPEQLTPAQAADPMPPASTKPQPSTAAQAPAGDWTQGPVSTQGTGLLPSNPEPRPEGTGGHEVAKGALLEERVSAAELRIRELEDRLGFLKDLSLSGFVQPALSFEFYNAAASPNGRSGVLPAGIGSNDVTARADGTTTNNLAFRLRRARLRLDYSPSAHGRFVFEIDAVPTGSSTPGVGTNGRTLYGEAIAKWTKTSETGFRAGLFRVPFGRELVEWSPDRLFLERSWGIANMFPGERDLGVWAHTEALKGALTVDTAVMNGQLAGEATFIRQPDRNRGKDGLLRASYNFGAADVGVSGLVGQGDLVDPASFRFKQYVRYAVNVEAGLHHTFVKKLGQTRLLAELTLGQNMDRGVNYAFALPVLPLGNVNQDVLAANQRSIVARLEQDIEFGGTKYGTLGVRYHQYAPDTSIDKNRRDQIDVALAGHVAKGVKVQLEYAHATDNVRIPGFPAPGKEIDSMLLWMQARF
jgi:hypothetical protein